jgi:uncharacterized MAPEG superfamily protein
MPIAYWCVLIAALLPIVWVSYSKSGAASDNQYPREEYDDLPPAKRRAYAAHQNAFEAFPFFAAAVIIAVTGGAAGGTLNLLAVLYILLRIGHGLLYIGNYSTPRSAIFGVALLVNIAIFVLPAFH